MTTIDADCVLAFIVRSAMLMRDCLSIHTSASTGTL
jgi:hypothetical protein